MRAAKWTAIVAGGLVLLLLAAVFIATSVIDPNRYRAQVEKIVGDLAGRRMVIEGDLRITWFPWLGARLGRGYLEDRPNGSDSRLLEWDSIALAAKVVPLLKGQVVVDRIRLQGPHIRLHRDAGGTGNWENLGPRQTVPVRRSADQGAPVNIAGLEVRNGTVDYSDDTSGQRVQLSSLDLDVSGWQPGNPVDIGAKFVAHASELPPAGVPVELSIPGVVARAGPLNVSAPKFSLRLAGATIQGDLHFDSTRDGHSNAAGSASIRIPSVRRLAADLALNQTLPHDPTTLGSMQLDTGWNFRDGAFVAKPISLKLDGVTFAGWLERRSGAQPAWRFELHGDRIDLGRYVKVDSTSTKPFELPTDALRSLNANGSVVFDQAVLADTHMSDVRLEFQTPESTP